MCYFDRINMVNLESLHIEYVVKLICEISMLFIIMHGIILLHQKCFCAKHSACYA